MGKIIYYLAISLDGYLADEDGGVDWLMPFQNAPYDYGYADFLSSIGYVLSGSKTYEQARNFPGGWNFPETTSYIFSSRNIDTDNREDIILWNDGVRELAEKLKREEKDTWLLGGAHLAGQFFNEGTVDKLVLSVMPVVLGSGKPMLEGIKTPFQMQLDAVVQFPNGVVQTTYSK